MSITYYAYTERELPYAGVQPDDLVIYTGTIRDDRLNGPTSASCPSKAYAYRWTGDEAEEIYVYFTTDDVGSPVMDITSGAEHYVFLLNEARTFLCQTSGPQKPVVVANIGADAIRVDTFLGKYSIPAGTVLRLDENAPRREKKTVLLTFAEKRRAGSPLESAMLLDGVHWRPLITCDIDGSIQIKDGPFVVQTLTYHGCLELRKRLLHQGFCPETAQFLPEYSVAELTDYIITHSNRGFRVRGYAQQTDFYNETWANAWSLLLASGPDRELYELCRTGWRTLPEYEGNTAPAEESEWSVPAQDMLSFLLADFLSPGTPQVPMFDRRMWSNAYRGVLNQLVNQIQAAGTLNAWAETLDSRAPGTDVIS